MILLRDYALQYVGTLYKWAGNDPIDGFDCSGFIQELLASVGIDPVGDQTAQGLYDCFSRDGIWNSYTCGSLAFYGEKVTKITHIAMLLDPYRIIEAGGGGSKCNTRDDAAEKNAFIRIRPIKYRSDLVAIIKPRYPAICVV